MVGPVLALVLLAAAADGAELAQMPGNAPGFACLADGFEPGNTDRWSATEPPL